LSIGAGGGSGPERVSFGKSFEAYKGIVAKENSKNSILCFIIILLNFKYKLCANMILKT
jgi:hypothetical protein